jgi:putative transcriptional regulator
MKKKPAPTSESTAYRSLLLGSYSEIAIVSKNRTRNTALLKRGSSSLEQSRGSFLASSAPDAGKPSGSSRRGKRRGAKEENIVRVRVEDLAPPDPKVLSDLRRMTDAEVIAAARSDPDNPPLTEEQLRRFKRAVPPPDAKVIRKATGLSQSAFAWRYGFDVSALRDWEQGRRTPDRSARVLLAVIKYEPEAVQRALAAWAWSRFDRRK